MGQGMGGLTMKSMWMDYLVEFEEKVLLKVYNSSINSIKTEPVPIRPGKLLKTPFGEFIGRSFTHKNLIAFNYYGLFKISSGIIQVDRNGSNTVVAPVIHFSSVKIEHVEQHCKELIVDFVSFKKFLVGLRWKK